MFSKLRYIFLQYLPGVFVVVIVVVVMMLGVVVSYSRRSYSRPFVSDPDYKLNGEAEA